MRRLTVAALIAAGLAIAGVVAADGCASIQRPPGGEPRHTPPVVVATSPDSGEKGFHARSLDVLFDEVIADQPPGPTSSFSHFILISPEVGDVDVDWHRYHLTIKGHQPFRPNTAYTVTLLPGIHDLHGNSMKQPTTIVFATGDSFPRLGIHGRVFDWQSQQVARAALVVATTHLTAKDSLVYITSTDTGGSFILGPMAPGKYSVLGFIDQDNNRALGRTEKWDRADVTIDSVIPTIELDAIVRDSAAPFIASIDTIPKDSLAFKVDFTGPIDPTLDLTNAPLFVTVRHLPDSTKLTVDSVVWYEDDIAHRNAAAAAAAKARRDTAGAPVVPIPTAPQPAAVNPNAPPKIPPPKPRSRAPSKSIVIYLSPSTPIRPGQSYHITVTNFKNLLGNSRETSKDKSIPIPKPPTVTKPPARP